MVTNVLLRNFQKEDHLRLSSSNFFKEKSRGVVWYKAVNVVIKGVIIFTVFGVIILVEKI